ILMIYYTTVSGWLFSYAGYYARGQIDCATPIESGAFFGALLASPGRSTGYMLLSVVLGTLICWFGVQKGVEQAVKYMMGALLVLMVVLAGYALTTPGACEGLAFYLKPDWSHFAQNPLETTFAAMGQAFFTLSLGVGSMTIFGSYLGWKKPLATECAWIIVLDTAVALCAGLIIFPICKSYNINPAQGPGLLFVSLPNAFHGMTFGRIWGTLFFIFMSLAALTTIVAVFENLIAYLQDEHRLGRKTATLAVGLAVAVLSLPCVFGFNLWEACHPLGGTSTILDFEDFIVSQNLLPLGSLCLCIFAFAKTGWDQKRFVAELEEGQRWKYPKTVLFLWRYLLPVIILAVFALGYWQMFFHK
ncbi:MAG: sodium-dependent transporter, partial [Victivallales bacterium]|nr:sodium-dependent transporter [Victivallales bacterium]